jgi:Na+-translocating ferredoxin:NAD+ oxidoreductase subunit G
MSTPIVVTPPTAPAVKSSRLLATLGGAGALAGFLIVVVYQLTLPAVEANRAARLDAAVHQVLLGLDRYETLYLHQGTLVATPPAGVDARGLERVYAGFDAGGRRVGFAISAAPPGFQDAISLLFGFDPSGRKTLGLAILGSRETPGLGDKIEGETFLSRFRAALTPITAVKSGAKENPNDVEMITGATISSRAVIAGINAGVERWTPILDAYIAGGAHEN